jgi:hypothetical protein
VWRLSNTDEHYDRWKPARCDLTCRLNFPDTRHVDVHQHQIGPQTLDLIDAQVRLLRAPDPSPR